MIKDFLSAIAISIKWSIAHFVKKTMMILLCILIVPMLLLGLLLELLSSFFKLLYDALENLFGIMYDFNKPFIIALFKSFGFSCGNIYLGTSFNRIGLLKLKEVAKANDIKCYIIEEMFKIEDDYFVQVIVAKKTDLNLLKLIFNTTYDTRAQNIF